MVLLPQAAETVSTVCAFIATACAVFVAFRDTMWRQRGLAKELSDRIAAAHDKAEAWHTSHEAQELRKTVERHGRALANQTTTLAGLATKDDVRDIKIEAAALKEQVQGAAAGIDRIEGILIRRAISGDGLSK
jgi:hypothetical protein